MKTFINPINFNKRLYDRDKYYVMVLSFSPNRPNLKIREDKICRIYLTGKEVKEFKDNFICIPISDFRSNESHIKNKYLDQKVGELYYHPKARTFRDLTIKMWNRLHRIFGFNYTINTSLHEIDSYGDYSKLITMISLCK